MATSLENIISDTEINRMTQKREKYKGILYDTDHHYPYMDKGMAKVEKQILEEEKPWMHIMGGDWIDGAGLSGFDPSPDYIMKTQDEIDGFVEHLGELYQASPDTKRVLIYGNHDEARKQLAAKERNAFGLSTLRVLNFKNIFKEAAEYKGVEIGDIEFAMEYEVGPKGKGILFVHGDKRLGGRQAALKGGVTGIRRNTSEFPYQGRAVVIGHGHRMQTGVHPWVDTEFHMVGWMGDNDKVGYPPHTRYQNGLMWIDYSPNSRPDPIFHINNIKVQPNREFVLNGKTYQAK